MQSALERRLAIYNVLLLRGKITHEELIAELKPEFNVSLSTIRRDIDYLCLEHDVTVMRGRNGGVILKQSVQYEWKVSAASTLQSILDRLTDEKEIQLISNILELNIQDNLLVKKSSHRQ